MTVSKPSVSEAGLGLLEILIVVTIIGVLAAIVVSRTMDSRSGSMGEPECMTEGALAERMASADVLSARRFMTPPSFDPQKNLWCLQAAS